MNASIEAARAGEQGKGFGVVASAENLLQEIEMNSKAVVDSLIELKKYL